MTFKEYVETNYPDLASNIDNYQNYSELYQILFPNYLQISHTLDDLNYKPFDYGSDPVLINYYGGHVVMDIAQYIGENYYNNDISKRFTKVNTHILTGYSALRNKILMLMYRYKYKWHALYESMILDGQYNPLDNVDEIYDETITRTPDLTYTDTSQNVYGSKETNTTNIHGAQQIANQVNYGATSETDNEIIGGRSDTKSFVNGATSETDTTTHTVNPFDNPVQSKTESGDSTTHSTEQYTNSESDTIGTQSNSVTKSTTIHTDSSQTNTTQYTDTVGVIDGSHTDSVNGTKTETGEEETIISRRRHGNIGVTKATELIESYRKLHYFDLIAIMSNDIINEIFDLNFES